MTSAAHVADTEDAIVHRVEQTVEQLTFGATRKEPAMRKPPRPAFHSIVASVDASPASERALAWAKHLAKLHGAKVIIASVHDPPHYDRGYAMAYAFYAGYIDLWEQTERRLHDAAESAAQMLQEEGIDATSVVTTGSPAHELESIARTHQADLVILAPREHHGLGKAFASVSDALLDRVPASVLLARTQPDVKQVLAPTDGSRAASRALAYAIRYAQAMKGEVVIQHVLDYPEESAEIPSPGLLRDVVARMKLDAPPRITYRLDAGNPARRIVEMSRETGADLIVLGSRGAGRVRGWLLGSVSRRVAANAETNVLLVKEAHAVG